MLHTARNIRYLQLHTYLLIATSLLRLLGEIPNKFGKMKARKRLIVVLIQGGKNIKRKHIYFSVKTQTQRI